jgi:hypothetical protein
VRSEHTPTLFVENSDLAIGSIPARELRPPEEVDRFEKFVAQKVIRGDAGTWTHRRKDGTNFTVKIRYHALEYNGSRARFVIVTLLA